MVLPVEKPCKRNEERNPKADREFPVTSPEANKLIAAEFVIDLAQKGFVRFRRKGQG
ncbi:hypothetical protein [Sphingomonas sp. GC_Shp_6]